VVEKTILVTGGAGYVGSLLVPKLLGKGYKVRVLDNLMYRQTSLLPYFINSQFEFVRGDVRDTATIKECLDGVDTVIHLAAIVGAPACARDPQLAAGVNYESSVLIDECRSRDQELIFASTGSNYGAVDGICTEETPLAPLSDYGITKTKAEVALMEAGNVVVYRFATAFGLSPRLRLDLMINDFTFQALKNRQLIVFEKGFRRTFIHVRDMAKAFIHAVENYDQLKDQVYNVGHESMNYTKEEVAVAIQNKIDYHLNFNEIGSDPDARDYEVSFEKIRRTGFETEVTLDAGINELINGYKMIDLVNPYSNIEA